MKSQSGAYPRTDWSSEVKTAPGENRAPSGTGLGGMERESRETMRTTREQRASQEQQATREQSASSGQQATRERRASREQQAQTSRGQPSGDWLVTDADRPGEYGEEERLNAVSNPPQVLNGQEMNEIWPNIENHLPNDVIESPTTMEEVYRGSMKALLLRNVGNYVVATFLIGTQTTVSWEGILYDVGNDYLAIYQSGRDQYIVSDLYSLKYVEFYDTRRRALCDELLTEQQPAGNSQRM